MTARQPTATSPDAAFLPLWTELPDQAGWQMLVSPAFPAAWPVSQGGGAVVRYAFAMRLTLSVSDGAEMAKPWASSTLATDGAMTVQRLSTALDSLGLQGVRPLRSTEIALASREQEVAGLLRAGGKQARGGLVRAFTCSWISRHSVVAGAITPLHPGFIHWLACSQAGQ